MRFQFNGSEHSISFTRKTREVTRFNGEKVISTHPYTTVTIETITRDADGKVTERTPFRTASVGTLSGDTFTYEKGRLAALRSVSRTLDKDFKKVLWKTYTSRTRG